MWRDTITIEVEEVYNSFKIAVQEVSKHLKEKRVMYHDLKPGNVLISRSGRTKLVFQLLCLTENHVGLLKT